MRKSRGGKRESNIITKNGVNGEAVERTRQLAILVAIRNEIARRGSCGLDQVSELTTIPRTTVVESIGEMVENGLVLYTKNKSNTLHLSELGATMADKCVIVRSGEKVVIVDATYEK